MQHQRRRVSRRAALGAGAVAAVAGGYWFTRRSTDLLTGTPSSDSTPTSTPTTTPTRTIPTRAELVQKYAGRVPREWGLDVTGMPSRTDSPGVLLTLDLCGGPGGAGLDHKLIDLLVQHGIPAGVFVNARWIDANPGAVEKLVATGLIDIGNHGTTHRPLSVTGRSAYGINGTTDVGAAVDEVLGCQEKLTAITGQPPRWFRSGTAHYDEVAVEIVREIGAIPVGFSVNGDAGATASAPAVAAALRGARPGDIVIAHANRPGRSTFEGFARALPGLIAGGTRFVRLTAGELVSDGSPQGW